MDDQEMLQYYIDLKQEGVDNEVNKFEGELVDVFDEIDSALYKSLRDAYEDLMSDEVVWETIVANEWDKEAA
jgi:CO dehydrogenase/acetyl-CoA synthase delta subunit